MNLVLPLPSLMSSCLNLPFGIQGRSRRLNEAYFLKKERGTQRLLPGAPEGPALFQDWTEIFWVIRGLFCFVLFFRATPLACGSSQFRGQIELQLPAYTTGTAACDPSHVWDLHHSS